MQIVLVLVSFGLVLLATILLVVGLLTDDGLNLIYFSIAASFTAAVVLYLAFRMAKPKGEAAPTAPEPLDEDLAPAPTPAATAAVPTTPAPAPAAPSPASTPAPAPAASREDDWVRDEDWTDESDWEEPAAPAAAAPAADEVDYDYEFPIADYDDLKVGEILPLLPQLYSDELGIVAERERAGKNRSTILDRLAELAETGTEADRLEEQAEAAAPSAAPATTVQPGVDLGADEDEDWDDEYFFPIADYDELTVAQIMPLLPQLELDELEEVKEREVGGQARKSLITEIDRYLSGELEVGEVPQAPVVEPQPARASVAPELPIAGYADLKVAEIRPLLTELDEAELEQVLDYEVARDNRKTIVDDIERRIATERRRSRSAPATKQATKKRAAKKTTKAAPAKKRTAKKAGKKRATKKRTAKKASKKRATKKATASRFPIANYDELPVNEIRPRLTDLSDRQLEQIRERELTGAGRKTILDIIDAKLS